MLVPAYVGLGWAISARNSYRLFGLKVFVVRSDYSGDETIGIGTDETSNNMHWRREFRRTILCE